MTELKMQGERRRFDNDFQRPFSFHRTELDALYSVLENMIDYPMPIAPDGQVVGKTDPVLECDGISLYGATKGQNAFAWVHSGSTGDSMYIRNPHHAKGLQKELASHASAEHERPTIHDEVDA